MTSTTAGTSLSLNSGLAHQAQMSNQNSASTLSLHSQEFWEFVCCGKCHLPFISDGVLEGSTGGPTIPFWLTECGHILCNQHLNPNQTCPCCGAAGIEVIPLHRDLPSPMADWFQSLPEKMDGMAQAIKFQQESLISLVRYYRRKIRKLEATLERSRPELQNLKVLRMEVEHLRQENANLRQMSAQTQYQMRAEPSDSTNGNGKRRMLDAQYRLTSSPRSNVTPSRLTLGPDHEPPSLPNRADAAQISMDGSYQAQSLDRPGTNRFAQKYAYAPPPQTPLQNQQQVLSHAQQAPMRRTMVAPQGSSAMLRQPLQVPGQSLRAQPNQAQPQRMMPPPPTPLNARHARAHGAAGQPQASFGQQQMLHNRMLVADDGSTPLNNQQGTFTTQPHPSAQYQPQRVQGNKFRPVMASRQGLQEMPDQSHSSAPGPFSFAQPHPQTLNQPSRRFAAPANAASGAPPGHNQMLSNMSGHPNRMVPATPAGGRFSTAVAATPLRHGYKPSTSIAQNPMPGQSYLGRNRSLGTISS